MSEFCRTALLAYLATGEISGGMVSPVAGTAGVAVLMTLPAPGTVGAFRRARRVAVPIDEHATDTEILRQLAAGVQILHQGPPR